MTRLRKLLHENLITLIVGIPENKLELAQTAEKAGADALILQELDGADEIIKNVKIPVGLTVNPEKEKSGKQLKKFDFIDFQIDQADQIKELDVTRVMALGDKYSLDELSSIAKIAHALDAAIIPSNQAIKDMSVGDLQNYISIIISSDVPVIIPTQRAIHSSEVAIIWDAGAKGIILTKSVFGNSKNAFEKTIKEFRAAVDDLGA